MVAVRGAIVVGEPLRSAVSFRHSQRTESLAVLLTLRDCIIAKAASLKRAYEYDIVHNSSPPEPAPVQQRKRRSPIDILLLYQCQANTMNCMSNALLGNSLKKGGCHKARHCTGCETHRITLLGLSKPGS